MTEKEKKASAIVRIALDQIGKPYVYGACYGPEAENPEGFDCSSLTQFCIQKALGIKIPRSSLEQAADKGSVEISSYLYLEPGDLIFFEGTRGHYRHDLFPSDRKILIGHVAIYSGEGKIVHATNNSRASGVVEQRLRDLPVPPYSIVMIKRW